MKKIISVPYIDQTEKWPTGCESVSAVMCLQYWGFDITVDELVEKYLEKVAFEKRNGELYGADPRKQFAGSPYDPDSFGCYAPVIVKVLQKATGDFVDSETESVMVKDLTGVSMTSIVEDYIDRNVPVILWASIDLKETIVGPEWKLLDSGEVFTWISNEHCMLLVGYDEEHYYFNDPWHNHGVIGYEKELVEKRHAEQYEMAVVMEVQKKNDVSKKAKESGSGFGENSKRNW